jgi:hypothetical protein
MTLCGCPSVGARHSYRRAARGQRGNHRIGGDECWRKIVNLVNLDVFLDKVTKVIRTTKKISKNRNKIM